MVILIASTSVAGAGLLSTQSQQATCSVLPVDQTVSPKSTQTDEDIEITTTIENTCDDEQSTDVVLMKDGEHVKQREATLAPHSTTQMTFVTSFSTAGEHTLAIFPLDPITVTIEKPNQPPVINSLDVPQIARPNETIAIGVEASDPDGDSLDGDVALEIGNQRESRDLFVSETDKGGPFTDNVTFDLSNLTLNVTPENSPVTLANVTVNVTDMSGGWANDTAKINISKSEDVQEAIAQSDGQPGTSFDDVLIAIAAFNAGYKIDGYEITFHDVLDAISRFNLGE